MFPSVSSNVFLPRGISGRDRLGCSRGLGNRWCQQGERLIHVAPRLAVICVRQDNDCQLVSRSNLDPGKMARKTSSMTDAHLVTNAADTESQAPTAAPVWPQPLNAMHFAQRRSFQDLRSPGRTIAKLKGREPC